MFEKMMISAISKIRHFQDSGPGPTKAIFGNKTEGYFGTLTNSEFIDPLVLVNKYAIPKTKTFNAEAQWMKFYIDEKIVFIPLNAIGGELLWSTLYLKGLIYGDDSVEGYPPSGLSVFQDQRISIQGYTFKIRLVKGSETDPYVGTLNTNDATQMYNSEWNRLLYPMMNISFTNDTREKWQPYASNSISNDIQWVQESSGANTSTKMFRQSLDGLIGNSASNITRLWRPCLELVINNLEAPRITNVSYVVSTTFSAVLMYPAPGNVNLIYIEDTQDQSIYLNQLLFVGPTSSSIAYSPLEADIVSWFNTYQPV